MKNGQYAIFNGMYIKSIINNWDPVGLLPGAPDDEYHTEISQIEHLLQTTKDVFELGEGIYNIFLGSFGDEVFRRSKSECITIAQSILIARL